jgi:hypothetical protein
MLTTLVNNKLNLVGRSPISASGKRVYGVK